MKRKCIVQKNHAAQRIYDEKNPFQIITKQPFHNYFNSMRVQIPVLSFSVSLFLSLCLSRSYLRTYETLFICCSFCSFIYLKKQCFCFLLPFLASHNFFLFYFSFSIRLCDAYTQYTPCTQYTLNTHAAILIPFNFISYYHLSIENAKFGAPTIYYCDKKMHQKCSSFPLKNEICLEETHTTSQENGKYHAEAKSKEFVIRPPA